MLSQNNMIKKKYLPFYEEQQLNFYVRSRSNPEKIKEIIENNLNSGQDARTYFSSIYTGITRSEQGSIVITNNTNVTNGARNDRYNKVGLSFQDIKDTEIVPNSFTDEGISTDELLPIAPTLVSPLH